MDAAASGSDGPLVIIRDEGASNGGDSMRHLPPRTSRLAEPSLTQTGAQGP